MTVTLITAGIKTAITTLTPTAVELKYGINVPKNKFESGISGYAVIPDVMQQVPGVLSTLTVDQSFTIKLARAFGQAQTSDAAEQAAAVTLYQEMFNLCKRLVAVKPDSSVILVSEADIGKVEYTASLAWLVATIKIKSRASL